MSVALERFSQRCSDAVAAVPDEVEALARGKELQRDRDELDDLVEVARARGPQKRLQLRKRKFDRIEVGTVGRQKAETGADPLNGGLHVRLLMHGKVIEHDDVAGPQRGDEHLLDIGEKRGVVDRPIEDRRGVQPVHAQGGDHRVRVPMPIGRVVAQPEAPRAAAVAADQVGGDARLVDEDVAARIVQGKGVLPPPPRGGDISAPLFVGEYRFF